MISRSCFPAVTRSGNVFTNVGEVTYKTTTCNKHSADVHDVFRPQSNEIRPTRIYSRASSSGRAMPCQAFLVQEHRPCKVARRQDDQDGVGVVENVYGGSSDDSHQRSRTTNPTTTTRKPTTLPYIGNKKMTFIRPSSSAEHADRPRTQSVLVRRGDSSVATVVVVVGWARRFFALEHPADR